MKDLHDRDLDFSRSQLDMLSSLFGFAATDGVSNMKDLHDRDLDFSPSWVEMLSSLLGVATDSGSNMIH